MEKGASESSPLDCARCGKPASLQCPKCAQLKLPREAAAFCSQDCFKAAWVSHKSVHTKLDALTSQLSQEGWKYCLKKGRTRTLERPRFDWTGPLRPFPISKMRLVPDEIEKPDWALDGIPKIEPDSDLQKRVEIKTPEQIERMRETCRIARQVLDAGARLIKPGITTDEIDRVIHEETIARGGYPSPLNYHFFPKSCCTSVNEVICHGIPDARKLEDGDIVNIDVTVYYKGVHGDLNDTYFVGNVDEASKQLVRCTYECLEKAISLVKPGVRFREVGEVINRHASMSGFSVVKSYCGHGIGGLFHCAPNIPHYSRNKAVGIMKPGQTFTIEPMINAGKKKKVAKQKSASMHASHVMICLLSLCLMALLLSPTSAAEPPRPSPAAGVIDEWLDDLPVEIVSALQASAPGAGGTEDDAAAAAADGIIAVPPARRQGFRPPRHPSALSPEAMRKLEHEARCGPRVPVRPGSQRPEWIPRCRGGDDDAVDGSATGVGGVPAWTRLPPDVDEP